MTTPDDSMHPLPAAPACRLRSPVLIMLASAEGLTGAALSAAEALRLALDERHARLDRLDALDRCLDWLPVVMPETRALERLGEELLAAVETALQGPRHRELQLKSSVAQMGIQWRDLRSEAWDTDNPTGLTERLGEQEADWLRQAVVPLMRLCWREPLDEQLHDTEDAAALIRLLRLYVLLHLDTSLDHPAQPMLNACAGVLGLWAEVEQRLPQLPTRPGGPAALYTTHGDADQDAKDAQGEASGATQPPDPAAALQALLQDSRQARQQATRQVAGHTDIITAAKCSAASSSTLSSTPSSSDASPSPSPSAPASTPPSVSPSAPPLVPKSLAAEAAITAAREASIAASKSALAAHEAALAERYAPAALEALRPHTRWQVISESIPEMREKDDRLTLASYEGLRVPLPLVLLPAVAELEARITQLHGEFPWASRAIEVAAGEMLARRRLGAVSFAWAPILLVGPPGTGKTRLARRLAEVMGLAFLPLGVGGSSDSRLLTGTSRGWASGDPSPIVRTLRDRRLAQILVLLDEVDKCSTRISSGISTHTVNAAPIQATLLGLLEPESSRNWIDSYLQVPCDLSKLLYVATANRLGTIEAALMSRLQPVLVPTPERQHYPMIIAQVVQDVASDWGLPVEVMPSLDVSGLARAAGSVRELVRLVRREIVREVSVSGAPH